MSKPARLKDFQRGQGRSSRPGRPSARLEQPDAGSGRKGNQETPHRVKARATEAKSTVGTAGTALRIAGYEIHPAANLFPIINDAEIQQLADDIRKNGLQHEIVLTPDGRVLDGRNRLLACQRAKVKPTFTIWTGPGDPIAWVLSTNLHRRHLDESQRAVVAAKAQALFREAARQRMHAGRAAPPTASFSEAKGESRQKAASLVNVSGRSVDFGSKVLRSGVPELLAAVEAGKASVSAAAEVASLSAKRQIAIISKGERAILKAAQDIRARRSEEFRAARFERDAELAKSNAPLASIGKGFQIVVIDPPWRYDRQTPRGERDAVERHYPSMSLEELIDLRNDLHRLLAKDAIVFLWATNPKLNEAFELIKHWGLEYKTCLTWDKKRLGLGVWSRGTTEQVLICTRGNPSPPRPSDRPTSLLVEKRSGPHSSKPSLLYSIIETCWPHHLKCDIFSRKRRSGWASFGNQLPTDASANRTSPMKAERRRRTV